MKREMEPKMPDLPHVYRARSRREFLLKAGGGFGALALAYLLDRDGYTLAGPADGAAAESPLAPKGPHFETKAKSVIFLFMEGGPSHVDLFDPKPELQKRHGQPLPDSVERVFTPMGVTHNKLLGSKRTFKKHGRSGIDVSDWYPHVAECADDIALIRSCWADGINHVGSVCQMNTGSILAGRPSMGAWVTYGLGTTNQSLPAFVILADDKEPVGGPTNWSAGFLPATYQGTTFQKGKSPIVHLTPPEGVTAREQRSKLDFMAELNRLHHRGRQDDSQLAARMASYELAYRMQSAAPEAVDLSKETEETKQLYGLDDPKSAEFGRMCLLARRLVERGVRFVQLYCGSGSGWDAHSKLEENHTRMCGRSDRPTAALIKDLKRRGLLESTLVVWGGEFGRTPMTEGTDGRDHNPYGFSMFLAGGGVKGGTIVGATDDFGLHAVGDRVHVHDLHATILHLMGMDHLKLTYLHDGRDERLTINGGKVVEKVLA